MPRGFFFQRHRAVFLRVDMKFGAVILMGGESRRMGKDKAKLKIGGRSFFHRLLLELADYSEVFASVSSSVIRSELPCRMVFDAYPGCGPMAGLQAALSACESDALLTLSCDLPLFEKRFGRWLCSLLDENTDAVIPITSDGRSHPLCAVYRKSCAAVFENFLREGRYKLTAALQELNVHYAQAGDFEPMLRNINTMSDYEALCAEMREASNECFE